MNPISQRLLNQQLICPQFTTPHDVVAWMGAMQAQEYKMMRWAVGMRTRRPSARAFEQDYNSGRIVRAHLFRHLAVQPDHMHRAHSGNGIFWPVILQDGHAIGNWTLAAGKVQTEFFHPDTPIALEPLQEQIERYTSFQA
jgi:hypothetical protein